MQSENDMENLNKTTNRRACVLWQRDSTASEIYKTVCNYGIDSIQSPKSDPDDGENIYQRIWNFKTIGGPRESYLSEMSQEAQDIFNENDFETLNDDEEWEKVDEFLFSKTKFINDFMPSPFQRVNIYYSLEDSKLNRFVYCDSEDNKNDKIISQLNQHQKHLQYRNNRQCSCDSSFDKIHFNNNNNNNTSINNKDIPNFVKSWKINLLNFNLMEDEEDVIMTEKELNDLNNSTVGLVQNHKENTSIFKRSKNYNLRSNGITNYDDITGITGSYKRNDSEDDFIIINENSFSLEKNKSINSSNSSIPNLKNLNQSSSSLNSDKKLDKNKRQDKEKDKKREKDPIFGVSIEQVELDDEIYCVPKFVVECIRFIEIEENLETNGIYRASGNKTSIEFIKKKMNEKPKRGTSKYEIIKSQDLHTITGVFKLFLREINGIVTSNIFNEISNYIKTKEENHEILTEILNKLETRRRMTLKYLIKHLKKVNEYSSENLMSTANLAIIFGASIFQQHNETSASSSSSLSSATNSQPNLSIPSLFITDIAEKTTTVKILIDNYDKIFETKKFNNL